MMLMKATQWEFENRALLFGLLFAVCFPLYAIDHENSASVLAQRLRGNCISQTTILWFACCLARLQPCS